MVKFVVKFVNNQMVKCTYYVYICVQMLNVFKMYLLFFFIDIYDIYEAQKDVGGICILYFELSL